MNAIRLYQKHTQAELIAMRDAITADPSNRDTLGSIYIYKPAARRKLDAIDLAITMRLEDTRNAAGQPVSAAGYSGRQAKRRR